MPLPKLALVYAKERKSRHNTIKVKQTIMHVMSRLDICKTYVVGINILSFSNSDKVNYYKWLRHSYVISAM